MQRLAERLARGDEAAFAELYDTCADGLHRYAATRLKCADAANDVVQATFLRAVKSRKRFGNVENPVAYMFEIARNEISRLAAKVARRRETSQLDQKSFAVRDEVSRDEEAEVALGALAQLSEEDRELVELKVFGSLTFAEVGAILGRPTATVATRYRRALESLRGWLERQLR